ncbi:MAG: shikimate dehydrogenase [Pelagibacteraceae bacterium]|jgi:shikimate dehydrogenase|nr:shikimate dehydrogenase [Pelagibacteraceae bacterium]MDP6783843.1 shikimate dehydrogenase [Alphaproteobacteria bacterium]MBO6466063.1 shikimate dehydrogenase [Pelagibacteraceae bacterium]MBO6467821.1 shikimate dehydrogenase [Pelagibacteraceae bacterium]MBO6469837.1 shikimate dehydrogenase [Pelagibacteraceae bacterium]|tara:strand:- start:2712 stop:3563 length:852 start_codon:yes stop_codon:yes gene_type:complete
MSKARAFVVGTNVNKSLSPTIFNYWFEKYRISAEYKHKEIKEENFDKEIKLILKDDKLRGLNITTPFKEKIITHLDVLEKHSVQIGAVNCVTKTEKKLEGMNTDWTGFEDSLKWAQKHKTPKIKRKNIAVVIGYGGSAKAIIYSLLFMGFRTIKVFNRSFDKIYNLKKIKPHKLEELEDHFSGADLIVNTVPRNIIKNHCPNLRRQLAINGPNSTGHGFDAVYNYPTFFLDYIAFAKRIDGIHMLIHQAIPCFHKWFGIKPEADAELVRILIDKRDGILEEKQ